MELKDLIIQSKKKTPVHVYLKNKIQGMEDQIYSHVLIGEWDEMKEVLEKFHCEDYVVETDRRNSALPLLDIKNLPARIEPGALIREGAQIHQRAIIMMGAIINAGSIIGEETMIDMGAVIGAQVQIGKRCHIGANAVLAGILEPVGARSVVIEDDVLIGANAVILEGIRIGRGAIVGAGSVVLSDVKENEVVAGVPASFVKFKDEKAAAKSEMILALRNL